MKKLLQYLGFLLVVLTLLLISPKAIYAQANEIPCYVDGLGTCNLDLSVSPPYCDASHELPKSCAGNPTLCCNSQSSASCSSVACTTLGAPPECDNGFACTGADPNACITANGSYGDCSRPDGTTGTCCIPSGETPPPELPPSGWYVCLRQGSGCVNGISPDLNQCLGANQGPCLPGDDSCTSCDELSTFDCDIPYGIDFISTPYECQEQNPTTGYWCAGGSTGCTPCLVGATNPECNPPPFASINECDPDGDGQCAVSSQLDPFGANINEIFCDSSGKPTTDPGTPDSPNRIYTAIGCIPVSSTQEFVKFLLGWAIGIAAGIAFLLIVFAGFLITTSAGNPQKLQAGKELLTAALMGLFLLIFSAFILRLIGQDILGVIPET